ncbi:MAG: 30S ribosomal protein S12 methylthiotransferase RimO [Verrucomicrobiota bacterium]|nr:30S ribosomal protein S12 methylthiotransferase RimO [Verrucomicrobiota bacterium]
MKNNQAELNPTTAQSEKVKVGMVSLGCAKNLVDAEIMLGKIRDAGMEITPDPDTADVIIVNTCSFIDKAKEESIDNIFEMNQKRGGSKKHKNQTLIMSGCMAQRFAGELQKEIPEVDAFMGIDQVEQVAEIINQARARRGHVVEADRVQASKVGKSGTAAPAQVPPQDPLNFVTRKPVYIPDYSTPRVRLTPDHFAYVKIGEGCNHPCSFCIIPQMRGKHRSRTLDSIVQEARQLVESGVKELDLISQDTTFWGKDLKGEGTYRLPDLLEALNDIPGDFWIRTLYTHPYHWSDELITAMARLPKVAKYIDMPLQHIDDGMLLPMRRETSSQYIRDLIKKIRAGIPGIAIRTTFIVGFPGETDEYFQTLLDFMEETRFERLGVFTYSQEDGTRAGKMEAQIDDRTKKSRYKKAMKLQRRIAAEISQSQIGREILALIDKDGVARGQWDAPDIDGRILIPEGSAKVGEFRRIKIIGALDYDLMGQPV